MKESQFTIASKLANQNKLFSRLAKHLGFSSIGDIERFLFSVFGKAIKGIRPADRPRGVFFVLEPGRFIDRLGDPSDLKPLLAQIQSNISSNIYSLRIDINGGLNVVYQCNSEDRRYLVGDIWPREVAQTFSGSNNKCVIWTTGVSASVFVNGKLLIESQDVIEELPAGLPVGFQNLSWSDGCIVFEFAERDLNDRSQIGIWQLPDSHLLRPKPETIIRTRLGNFLKYRLAGYLSHTEEEHVENEGRADISLYLVNGRVFIIEIKWIGKSLVGTCANATTEEIKFAIMHKKRHWLTEFDDSTIENGVKQLVRYYSTGKYRRAYLTVFDCSTMARIENNRCLEVPYDVLDGHSPDNFCILRACVDPRPASKRARS